MVSVTERDLVGAAAVEEDGGVATSGNGAPPAGSNRAISFEISAQASKRDPDRLDDAGYRHRQARRTLARRSQETLARISQETLAQRRPGLLEET